MIHFYDHEEYRKKGINKVGFMFNFTIGFRHTEEIKTLSNIIKSFL